eukprot:jgi/Botrbrau1/15514/Bobra.0225s0005.2
MAVLTCRQHMAGKEETQGLVAALLKRVEAAEQIALEAKTSASQNLHFQRELESRLTSLEKDLATMKQQGIGPGLSPAVSAPPNQAGKMSVPMSGRQHGAQQLRQSLDAGTSFATVQKQVMSLIQQVSRLEDEITPCKSAASSARSLQETVLGLQARLVPVEAGMARVQNAIGSFAVLATGQAEVDPGKGSERGPDHHTAAPQAGGFEGNAGIRSASGSGHGMAAIGSEESLSGVVKKPPGGFGRGHHTQKDCSWSRLGLQLPTDVGTALRSGRFKTSTPGVLGKRTTQEHGGSTSPDPKRKQQKVPQSVRRALSLDPHSYCKAGSQAQKGSAVPVEAGPGPSVSMVEDWIGRLTQGSDQPSPDLIGQVAAGLRSMFESGQCTSAMIVKGFEAAFLACSRPGPSPSFHTQDLPPNSTIVGALGWTGKDLGFDAQLEEQVYTEVWASETQIAHHTVSSLIQCVALIDGDKSIALLEGLRVRLHELAVKVHPEGHVPLYDSEAAVLCAALASICRLQDNVEALRVMMADLLLAWGPSGRSLPRFAAALSAWPLTLCPTSDLLFNTLYQCVTASLQDMCSTVITFAERDLAGLAVDFEGLARGVSRETGGVPLTRIVVAAAFVLQQLGFQKWSWQLANVDVVSGVSDRESDHPHVAMQSKALLKSLEAMLESFLLGSDLSSNEGQSRWENLGIALEITTLFLGCDWAYEEVLAKLLLPAIGNVNDISCKDKVSALAARVAGCMLSAGDDVPMVHKAVTLVCSHILQLWQIKASEQVPASDLPQKLGRRVKHSSLDLIHKLQQAIQSNG